MTTISMKKLRNVVAKGGTTLASEIGVKISMATLVLMLGFMQVVV